MRGDETQSIAGFDVLAKLSSGGMGDVLLARRLGAHGFEKLLAIKTIRGDLARRPDIRAMFLDEARLVARLDHPTIAQVYDFGEHGETLFLAMEYVPGIALNQLLGKRGGPMPPVVAMRMVAEVLRGLHAAHELCDKDGAPLGVVHRDVTPGNLILTFDGHIKILDFGIAFTKGRESPDTVIGELKGKPSYMAPEHLRGEKVDRRADLYSVSVVLHELLTGRKLFSRDTVVQTVMAVETQPVPRPSEFAGPLPFGLDEIVLKGLERKADNRFPDARTMASALDRLIASAPSAAQETLELFVEAELKDERDAHRAWLNGVLTEAATEKERPAPATSRPPSQRAHDRHDTRPDAPLAESTTLVPQGFEHAPVTAIKRPYAGGIVWFLVLGLSLVGAVAGYRYAFEREQEARDATPIVIVDKADRPMVEKLVVEDKDKKADKAATATSGAAIGAAVQPAEEPRRAHKVAHHAGAQKRRGALPAPEKRETAGQEGQEGRPQGFGFITVGAQPYALVRIDGQEIGATPIMNKRLPAGTHEVELVRPDSGEVRLKRALKLSDGEHQRITIP